MDRFRLMTVFVAVVDAQGFAGAARKLRLSPPTVTRAVSELEDRLGIPLFTRTTRIVRLTDAGAQYATDCRRILSELEEADAAASGAHATVQGHILVTAPVLFGRMHVAPIVREYLHRNEKVSATCWFMDRVVNMDEEGVDVAVRIGELPDSSLNAYRVGSVRYVCCASPGYLAEHGAPAAPTDLVRHRIVSATPITPSAVWKFSRAGEDTPVALTPRLTTSTNDTAIEAAMDNFGIVRLLSYQVADLVEAGRLRLVLEDFEPPPIPVHLLHREGRHGSKKVRAFIDLAIERLAGASAATTAGHTRPRKSRRR